MTEAQQRNQDADRIAGVNIMRAACVRAIMAEQDAVSAPPEWMALERAADAIRRLDAGEVLAAADARNAGVKGDE